MTHSENYSHSKFEEFPDISFVEMAILQILLKNPKPVIRYVLFFEVQQFLKDKKTLSTSSFYNSLANLEKKGYITLMRDDSLKKKFIVPNPSANLVINQVFQYFMENGLINDSQFLLEIAEIFHNKIGDRFSSMVLTILLDEYLNVNDIEISIIYSKNLFILTSEERQEEFNKFSFKNAVKLSEIRAGKIREPNDFFDVIVVSGYCKNPNLYGLSRVDILKEAKRVCKPEGAIAFTVRAELPKTHNFYVDKLIQSYEYSVTERTFSEEEIAEDLTNAGITNFEITEHKGLLIVVGWVK